MGLGLYTLALQSEQPKEGLRRMGSKFSVDATVTATVLVEPNK